MGFSVDISVPAVTVFLQGLLSFFSPCVLPLVPLYIGYLAGGTKTVDEDGTIRYQRKKILINTLFFVIGVSFAFFLLGFGFSAAGRFFGGNRVLFARIGGIIVVMFGLYQLGFFGVSKVLGREFRLPFQLDRFAMNPLLALVLGFTFSFAWTPCVGPALASVLLLASSASSQSMGFVLIGVYTLGFVIPFLGVELFTGSLLDFFKKHQNVVRYTVKAGGVLMILMGVMMWTGWMNGVSGYLSKFAGSPSGTVTESVAGPENGAQGDGDSMAGVDGAENGTDGEDGDRAGAGNEAAGGNEAGEQADGSAAAGLENGNSSGETAENGADRVDGQTVAEAGEDEDGTDEEAADDQDFVPAPDFTLTDQYGNTHKLSDYKGKTVFLNFWATWCGPCRQEMPDIQKIYEEYGGNKEDLIVLGVANPKTDAQPFNQDGTEAEIKQFLKDGGYTYPTLMDTTGDVFMNYYITSFPTTFMINTDGKVFGYLSGSLTKDIMENIIKQTMEGKQAN